MNHARYMHRIRSRRFTLLILLLAVCLLPEPVFANSGSGDPQLPYFGELVGEEMRREFPYVDRVRLFGNLEIFNPAETVFILQITFINGGRLEPWYAPLDVPFAIGLHSLELRYRDNNGALLSRSFSSSLTSGGYVYELEFLQEDMQVFYRMELWGRLNAAQAMAAPARLYLEGINFEILEKN